MARVWTERALRHLRDQPNGALNRMTATLDFADPQQLFDEPEYRVEGPLKVTGAARYTADVHMPGMLWLAYTRSPRPHARIVSVDTSAARQVPGVHAVLTGADIGHVRLGRRLLDWPALATDRVRMVGDRVAAVAAETKEAADEAAAPGRSRVRGPAPGDARQRAGRRRAGAPPGHRHLSLPGRRSARRRRTPTCTATRWSRRANPAPASRTSSRRRRPTTSSSTRSRPRASSRASWSRARAWCGSTSRTGCASSTPTSRRRRCASSSPRRWTCRSRRSSIDATFIGGDFGGKGLSIDEFTCYFLARATGRPIKAVMTLPGRAAGDQRAPPGRH